MAYDLQLAQLNTNLGGMSQANTAWGFPANANFSTLLMSYWMCGPVHTAPAASGQAGVWPAFNSAEFFTFDPGVANNITLTNQTLGASGHFYQGSWTLPSPGTRMHFLLSIDTHAQIVQLYVNDQPVTVTGTWSGTPPYNFNITNTPNIWAWNVSGVIASAKHPALGDVWISNTPAFVDLSVAANRRKFIAANWTPVDLGDTGMAPFGYQPALYMSVRPGGVATDILLNRGGGGGTWGYAQNPPSFQAPVDVCPVATPPVALNMDNVLAMQPAAAAALHPCLISLEWSNDRGHSWSNPVSQPMGGTGEYGKTLTWQRLGMARDRVWKLTWSCPSATALQGAWIEVSAEGKGQG